MAPKVTYSLKDKLRLFALFAVSYSFFYIIPNFYASWKPALLPLTSLEKAIPFLPWTFLIYTSDYVLIALAIFLISEREQFASFGRMMFFALIISGTFFWFFPTTYPRPTYPEVENVFIQAAMNLVYVADSPNNCFPSMHVALTTIAAWSLRKRSKSEVLIFGIWTLAVIVSTLTTKQHYLVDVFGGLSVVFVVVALETFVLKRYLSPGSRLTKILQESKFNKVF